MGIATDDPSTAVSHELLIEEARRRQRQRLRRRGAGAATALVLAGLGVAADQLVTGGNGRSSAPRAPVAALPGVAVVYEKLDTVKITPQLPAERRTSEIWSATNAPWTYRELLTVAGGPSVEIGAGPGHDQVFGSEQVVYLYRASANTIYRTGAYVLPTRPAPALRQAAFVRLLVARHRARLLGTRLLDGRRVYVLRWLRGVDRTDYLDARTYLPVKSVVHDGPLTIVQRTLVRKTLPATKANLDRTRLAASHPGARVRPAPQRVDELYAEAIGGVLSLSRVGWRALVLSETSG